MDSRLDIELKLIDSIFYAIDNSAYGEWISEGIFDAEHSHFVMERLIAIKSDEDNQGFANNSKLAETIDDLRENWSVEDLPNNLYYYQKILLPTQEHTFTTAEKLYYNTEDGKVYYFDSSESIVFSAPMSDEDFDSIYDLVKTQDIGNCFYFDDYFITINALIECYILNERERLKNFIKNNCQSNCNGYDTIATKSDLLLAAIMVINDLVDKEEFFEAQKILNRLNTCGYLCKDFDKTLNGCGCGKV